MAKALGIDYGTKRTGIAITDSLQLIASGLTTVSTHLLDNFICELLQSEEVDVFVIGYPKNLDGSSTDSTGHVNSFIKRLKEKYPEVPVEKIDERFTSKIAKRSLLASGVNKKTRKKKELVDKISATIILQNYLDCKK